MKFAAGEGKKSAKFWAVRRRSGPAEGRSSGGRVHHKVPQLRRAKRDQNEKKKRPKTCSFWTFFVVENRFFGTCKGVPRQGPNTQTKKQKTKWTEPTHTTTTHHTPHTTTTQLQPTTHNHNQQHTTTNNTPQPTTTHHNQQTYNTTTQQHNTHTHTHTQHNNTTTQQHTTPHTQHTNWPKTDWPKMPLAQNGQNTKQQFWPG